MSTSVILIGDTHLPRFGRVLGHTRIVVVEEARIGMTHGHLGPGRTTPERARLTFKEPIDAVAFGHSHQPVIEQTDDTWLLNPGSPTDRRRQPVFSFTHLEVDGRQMHPELVTYEAWR